MEPPSVHRNSLIRPSFCTVYVPHRGLPDARQSSEASTELRLRLTTVSRHIKAILI